MLHIKKTGTQFEAEGKKHTKDFIEFWKIFITTLLASSSEDKVKMR